MVTLEQIKLLESKISRAIDYFNKLIEENTLLKQQNDELRETIIQLKEEKTRMDEGIASALGKFNQFEDAIEKNLMPPSITLIPPQPRSQPPSPASAYIVDEDADETEDDEEPVVVDIINDNVEDDVDDDVIADDYDEEASEILELDSDDSSSEISDEDDDDTEDSGEAELDIF